MLDTILAVIQHADIDADCLQIRFRKRVRRVMQHVLVQCHMPFHRMWTQAVCKHDVVYIVVRPLYPIVELLEFPACLLEGDGPYPGHESVLHSFGNKGLNRSVDHLPARFGYHSHN